MSEEQKTIALDLLRQCVTRLMLTGGMLNKDLAKEVTKFVADLNRKAD